LIVPSSTITTPTHWERTNLARDPAYEQLLARLRKHLPTHHEADSPRNPYNNLKKSTIK